MTAEGMFLLMAAFCGFAFLRVWNAAEERMQLPAHDGEDILLFMLRTCRLCLHLRQLKPCPCP